MLLMRESQYKKENTTVYTNFHKASDLIDHSVLVAKLHKHGIREPLLSWFKTYSSGKSHLSETYFWPSGIPQGSYLIGSCLFSIFINDIGEKFNSLYLIVADDFKIYRNIESLADCA